MHFIPYSRQVIDEDDIAAVTSVLRSDFLTQGPSVPAFEAALENYCGSPFAIALSSGTAGLHLACMALGIGKGDHVWTSPNSFVASANCALYVGAQVDFIDVDSATGNIDPQKLEEKLETARKNNSLPKLIIAVHFAGRSCDMERISVLAKQFNIYVIEDAAHALGASFQGKKIGACTYSDAVLLSFHPVKSMTTGEGGALLVKDAALAERIKLLRSHGIARDPQLLTHKDEGAWYYEMQQLGYHYRLTDIQAALGISQMHKLDRFIERRRYLAQRYAGLLQGSVFGVPPVDNTSAWHLYVVKLADVQKRKPFFAKMREKNIGVNVHYIPIHLQPYYQKLGFKAGDFPQAEAFYQNAVSIPLYPTLKEEEQDYVVETMMDCYR